MKLKKISIISLMLVFIMTLTACTNEAGLYKAFVKQQKITSVKSQTDLKINIDAENLSEENQVIFNMVKDVVNNLELRIDQKTVSDKSKQKAQGKLFFTLKNKEQVNKATVWVDSDISDLENIKLVETFKLPEQMKSIFGEENKDKDYLVYDVNKLMNEMGSQTNANKEVMNNAMEWGIKVQPKLEKIMENYFKNFKFEAKLVTKQAPQTINGEKLEMYQIKLNDKQMKGLTRYTLNAMLDDKELNEVVAEYIDLIIKSTKAMENTEEAKGIEELEKIKDNKEIKVKLNEFMNKLDKITILGEKGITIDHGVNKDGFISYEKGDLNFEINLDDLNKLEENLEIKQSGKIIINLNYTSKLNQINDKTMVVDMPNTTKENSFDMVDYLKSMESKFKDIAPKTEEIK